MLDRYLNEIIPKLSNNESDKLNLNEYFILCSLQSGSSGGEDSHMRYTLYTNLGRLFQQYPSHKLICINSEKILRDLSTRDSCGRHKNERVYSINKEDIHLSQEYIEILNSNDFGGFHYRVTDFNRIVDIYKKYHPKATEICRIEMKQKEIQKSIIELQSLETKYATQKAHIDKQQVDINDQYEKLKKDQQVHKDKLKNLFQREKSVQMKETLHGCKEELKDIALQLNDMYVLTDSPDESIQSKLNDILGTLNTLYAESVNGHIMATPV